LNVSRSRIAEGGRWTSKQFAPLTYRSEARELILPRVVGSLLEAGVESYFADLLRREETFFSSGGETPVESLSPPVPEVAGDFLAKLASSPLSVPPRLTKSASPNSSSAAVAGVAVSGK